MCFETTTRPPLPPIAGGAGIASSGALELEASDGNRLMAFTATTAEPDAPGIVILPDVRGLHPFYIDLTERFASAGVHATAFDYFGRTAGSGDRGDAFEYREHVSQTTPDQVAADVAAAVAHVRSAAGGGARSVSTVGFCFGGRNSFNQAARGHGLAGVIGFYGMPQRRGDDDRNAPTDLAAGYECRVLGLFGGDDQAMPPGAVDEFGRALSDAGVPHELVTYPGAPHSFFDRTFTDYADECADAWRRMLEFVGRSD